MLSIESVKLVAEDYERELRRLEASPSENPHVQRLVVNRIRSDCPRLLHVLNDNKSHKDYSVVLPILHGLVRHADGFLQKNSKQIAIYSGQFQELEERVASPEPDVVQPLQQDNYASLRQRLLADGASTSLDKENSNSEQLNNYHESFQEDLLGDMANLASSIKQSALALSSKIVEDNAIVSETGENMQRNLDLMHTVGENLNSYLLNKSGGAISLFFMLKVMGFAFLLFACMVILTKILPKM